MHSQPRKQLAILLSLTLIFASSLQAALKLPAIFSDNMVLQRNQPVPVWGTASNGEKVTVSIAGQQKEATADSSGKWIVKLDALKPGEPLEMTVSAAAGDKLTYKNILVGEVWVCSGQSNMEWTPRRLRAGPDIAREANHPNLRLFTVKKATSEKPLEDVTGNWQPCSPETVMDFSAVGYFFGRELQKNLDVPIGLIHTSWGGTSIYLWMRHDVMAADPALEPMLTGHAGRVAAVERQRAEWPAVQEKHRQEVEKAKAENRPAPAAPRPPQGPPMAPASLYNAMIAPLIPYAINGAIWYQGESNANAGQVHMYRRHLAQMIDHWRKDWGQAQPFPFMIVQLANFDAGDPAGRMWAYLREAQTQVASTVPKAGLAVTIDIGEARDIHPQNKEDVGKRLAYSALAIGYGKDVEYSGPLFQSMSIEQNKARLSFTHAKGLMAKGDELKGFEIAGADKKYVPAEAKIDGQNIIVWSEQVKEPVAVRYAWANNPAATLYNAANLPAVPFRTDTWSREETEAASKPTPAETPQPPRQ